MAKLVDLSVELFLRAPSNPGQPPVIVGVWMTHEESLKRPGRIQGNEVMYLSMSDHAGTHIDAPRHFNPQGPSIDKYPLENCYVRAICLDFRHIPPRGEIGPAELEQAVKAAGTGVPKGGSILLCTGHHARNYGKPAYFSENSGVNVEGTEWIAKSGAAHFGIDCYRPSPEQNNLNDKVHKACADLGITHIEGLCNLESLIGKGEFQFIGLPLKIRNGTGGPMRAVALIDE